MRPYHSPAAVENLPSCTQRAWRTQVMVPGRPRAVGNAQAILFVVARLEGIAQPFSAGHTAPSSPSSGRLEEGTFSLSRPPLTPSLARFPFYPTAPPGFPPASPQLPYINAPALPSSPPSLQQTRSSQQCCSGAHRHDTVTALGELCEAREEGRVEHGLTRTETTGPAGAKCNHQSSAAATSC